MSDVEMEDQRAAGNSTGLAFDPDQDPEEKRAVRKDYRTLFKSVGDGDTNPNELSAEFLTRKVKLADTLFDRVKNPQEATLDSGFLLKASTIGAQKARALKSGSGAFDVDEFVSKLIAFMGGQSLEPADDESESGADDSQPLAWDRLGRRALGKSRRVPAPLFMLGPLSIEQKKRGPVKRNKLEKNKEDMRKPQELQEEDIQRSENETTKNVGQLNDLLANHGPVNLFKFVINPNDFAQSVENIFHLSFLVRDGTAAIETNEEGEPVVYICEAPNDQDFADGLKKNQIVFEFTMETWKRAIEVFNITEPLIPQRPPAGVRLNGKWYG